MEKSNNIYKSYKQRLISIDSRNSSFFLSRLLSKRHIDLVKISEQLRNDEFLKQIIEENTIKIPRLKINREEFFEMFINYDDHFNEEARDKFPTLTDLDFNSYEKLLQKNPSKKKIEEFLNDLFKKCEKNSLMIFKSFNGLSNQSKSIERDYGKNDLYLGFPFIEGKFQNEKDFRGPLLLHRVTITENGDYVEINILNEGKLINPVFLLAYLNENKKEYKRFDFEIPDGEKDYIKYSLDYLKKNGITLQNEEISLMKIDSITKKEYAKKYYNEINTFNLKYYAVLGLFPISNRNIFNDLDYLDKHPHETSSILEQFIMGTKAFDDERNDYAPKEDQIKYISPIDWSQRIVIKHALNESLVIEGPPGTGKSQTIVNIIINLLLKNKKILVVSEKLAAIEVVYNRLGKLRENTLIIKDYIRNKDDFFAQIVESKNKMFDTSGDKIYDSSNDYAISKYLEFMKEINNPNYFGEYSFEDVLNLSTKNFEIKLSSQQLSNIKAYIKEVREHNYNLHSRLEMLLQEETIYGYQLFNQSKKLPIFNEIETKDVYFLIDQIDKNLSKNQIQYNYYLYRLNNLSFNLTNIEEFNLKIEERIFNYSTFEVYAKSLFDKIQTNKKDIIDFMNPIYRELGLSKDKIRLAYCWNELGMHDRVAEVKKAFNPRFKQNLIKGFFHKKIQLTQEEQEFKDYLDNYSENFDKKLLSRIVNNIISFDFLIINEFIKRNYSTYNDLLNLLLNSCFIQFRDNAFDRIITILQNDMPNINRDILSVIGAYSSVETNILDIMFDTGISKQVLIDYVIYSSLGDQIINNTKSIAKYIMQNNENYRNVLNSFENKYEESAKFVYRTVKDSVISSLRVNSELNTQYNGLLSQAELKRRKSVKTIFDRYNKAITTVFPVILMTPDVVSAVFKLEKDMFDYVIFDEASQMFIERAVPAIHRSKRVVVAGDSKQLKPSSTFTARLVEAGELDDDDTITNAELEALDKESLLEMAKDKYKSRMIQFHYRSEHEELIEFSSAAFYDRKLFFASKIMQERLPKPIEVIQLKNGLWTDDNTNLEEAEKVVKLVIELLNNRRSNETIGIITFNIKQKELIIDMIEDLGNREIFNEMNRVNPKTGDDEGLFVKNIENVQGDERDIIIFSIGYAKNKDGRVGVQFGSLNKTGGENRLNVAITRAKKKIYVIKSIYSHELQVNDKTAGAVRLKQYLEFVDYVDQLEHDKKKRLLNLICHFDDVYDNALEPFDSPFEIEVYEEVKKVIPSYLSIKNQINVGGYLIDLAIYDSRSERFILGIECDGYQWHSKPEDIERDFYRQQYLESRGWIIHRIISTNWWNDKLSQIANVQLAIESIIDKPYENPTI